MTSGGEYGFPDSTNPLMNTVTSIFALFFTTEPGGSFIYYYYTCIYNARKFSKAAFTHSDRYANPFANRCASGCERRLHRTTSVQTGVPTDRRYVYIGQLVCIPVCIQVCKPSLQNIDIQSIYIRYHISSTYDIFDIFENVKMFSNRYWKPTITSC